MDRRSFAKNITAALVTATAIPKILATEEKPEQPAAPPYKLSVMLWTVYRDLPFEQRLERVAAAGYTNVELVGEYAKWSDAEFDRAMAARKRLGVTFD